jgi:excisionase family DNA binding protein
MPREADFYTPGEAARLLGLTEFTVLGLLTSGQLEGHQDEQARWWIPAAAVGEAVRRSRGADAPVRPFSRGDHRYATRKPQAPS